MSLLTGLNDWLVELLGPFGPLIAVGMLGVLMILIALPSVLTRRRDAFDRLREAVGDGATDRPASDRELTKARRALEKASAVLRAIDA